MRLWCGSNIYPLFLKCKKRHLIINFGETFLLLEDKEIIFYSASASRFVATGPAKFLKIGQK